MWYFSWALGLALACTFGILNAIWYELTEDDDRYPERQRAQPTGRRG